VALSINTNISALNAARNLGNTTQLLSAATERLSSGLRINRASDDAAGLSVREGLRADLAGLRASEKNASQANDLLQTAEGSLAQVNDILIRTRELAVQSDTNREAIQTEFSQLVSEIDRIALSTTFNNQVLLTGFGNSVDATSSALTISNATGVTEIRLSGAQAGTFNFVDTAGDNQITLGNGTLSQTLSVGTLLDAGVVATGTQVVANFDTLGIQVTLAGANVSGATGQFSDGDLGTSQIVIQSGTGGSFQVGSTNTAANRIEVSVPDLRATGPQLNLSSTSVASLSTAQTAITSIDSAISTVAQERGTIGAVQNRLNFSISSTEQSITSIQASESTISDADFAAEVTNLTRAQILSQVGTSILAQANLQNQNILLLLKDL
jgi:flagellin